MSVEFNKKLQRMIDIAKHEAASFRPESWVRLTTDEANYVLTQLERLERLERIEKIALKINEKYCLCLEPVGPHWVELQAALASSVATQ